MAIPKRDWSVILKDAVRFHLNKISHGFLEPFAARTETSNTLGSGFLKDVRVSGKAGSGRLQFCEMRDASGIRHVFQLPWMHMEKFLDAADDKARLLTLRRLIAALPSGACCNFVLGRNLTHTESVAETFRRVGFRVLNVDTFYYQPPVNANEVIETLTSKSMQKNLRKARRELELVDVSPSEFVRFYKNNMEAAGKRSYFDFEIDRVLFELGQLTGHIRILGARRKKTQQTAGPVPLDAAMVCTRNAVQNNYKFIRVTHRSHNDNASDCAPHGEASKLLILAAMEDAATLGLHFETDGTTPGMTRIYAMFGPGVFKSAIRIQCTRDTIWSLVNKQYPSLARKISRLIPLDRPTSQTSA